MVNVRKLSEELQKKAIQELNEDPGRVEDDLNYIKKWLSQQSYINARTDDQTLLTFLRGCKFSLEKTKEKIDTFYTLRTITPELYGNRDPFQSDIQEALSNGVLVPLSKLADPQSPRVFLLRSGCFDPAKIGFPVIFKLSSMIQDICMKEDDNFVVAGSVTVQDMKNFTISQIMTAPPTLIKKVMVCTTSGAPVRLKGYHFINTNSTLEMANSLLKSFIPEKLKKRVFAHSSSNLGELYKTIPRSILPEEYGGEGGKLDDMIAYWKEKVESYRDWFLEDEKYKTNEKKRPGKPKTTESMYGVDGSFRQLSLD